MRRPNGVNIAGPRQNQAWWVNEACYACDMGWGPGTILPTMRATIREYVTNYNREQTGDGHNTISWDAAAGAARYRVYRERRTDEGSKFMLVGTTTGTTFDDDNLAFVNTETPQSSNNPFVGPDNYPGVCTFYQQRLLLLRTNSKPNTVWGSQIGLPRNFNKNEEGGVSDTSAFEHTLQAEEVNEILWVKPMDDILIGTAGGEFRMGGGGYVISPTNVNATRQSNYGCSDIPPVIVGQDVVGVGHRNRVLRSYRWSYSDAAYKGTDLSEYAGHLFVRREIADLASQFAPESIIWVVMSDGALLSLTYMPEEKVLGWTRHDTDGRFEAVALMSDNEGDDEIWCIVAREINGVTKHFIERMKEIQQVGNDIADAWYVDCGLTRYGVPTDTLGGLGHLEGKQVVCLGDGFVFKDLTVVNGQVKLPRQVRRATVGLPYTAEVETVELEPSNGESIAHLSKSTVTASVLFYHSRECYVGTRGGGDPLPLNFQTEGPDKPIAPITVRKNFTVPQPIGDNRASLRLSCTSPVPFGVLGITLELAAGAANPGSGRPYHVGA
ncbi:MAG: hypothetical protein LUE17_00855 [Planctomycetaceae bacterium]|nr:hypothetical protein [Planctomycetaceae bacterium]